MKKFIIGFLFFGTFLLIPSISLAQTSGFGGYDPNKPPAGYDADCWATKFSSQGVGVDLRTGKSVDFHCRALTDNTTAKFPNDWYQWTAQQWQTMFADVKTNPYIKGTVTATTFSWAEQAYNQAGIKAAADLMAHNLTVSQAVSGNWPGGPNYKPVTTSSNSTSSATVDVKADGQDGGVSVPAFSNVSISWTSSGMNVCNISAPDASSRVSNSGSLTMTVPSRIGYTNNWPYTIYCLDSGGQRFSDTVTVSATPASFPAKPAPIPFIATMASGSDCQAVNISWGSYDLNTASSFNIYRDSIKVGSVNANVYNYQDTGLVVGKTYRYTVRAVGTNGESLDSNASSSIPSGSCSSSNPNPSTITYPTPTLPTTTTTTTKTTPNVLPVGCSTTAGLSPITGIACSSNGATTYYTSSTPTVKASGSLPINLIASPSSISAGQASTIAWSSTGFTSCSSIDFYVPRGNSTAGSAVVYPSRTTTFWIECTKSSGVEQKSVTITVGGTGSSSSGGYVPPTTTLPIGTTPPTVGTPTVVPSSYCVGNVLPTIPTPPGPVPTGWDGVYTRAIDLMATMQNNMSTNYVLAAQYNLLSAMLGAQGGQNDYTPPANIAPFHTWVNLVYRAGSAWVGERAVTGPNGQGILQTTTTGSSLSQLLNSYGVNWLPTCPGSSGTGSGSAVITSFTASPDSISSGNSSTLSWTTRNASSCEIIGSINETVPVNGKKVVSPSETSYYVLQCTSANGVTGVGKYVTVDGLPFVPKNPVISIDVSPNIITVPPLTSRTIDATVSWSTTNAITCSGDFDVNSGSVKKALSGSEIVKIQVPPSASGDTERHVFTLTCGGVGTNNISKYTTLDVKISNASQSNSTKFKVGDSVSTTSMLNVRSSASINGQVLGTQARGAVGKIISGGNYIDGYYWWQVDYVNGDDGWSAENYLTKSTSSSSTSSGVPASVNVTGVKDGDTVSGTLQLGFDFTGDTCTSTDGVTKAPCSLNWHTVILLRNDSVTQDFLGYRNSSDPFITTLDTKTLADGWHVIMVRPQVNVPVGFTLDMTKAIYFKVDNNKAAKTTLITSPLGVSTTNGGTIQVDAQTSNSAANVQFFVGNGIYQTVAPINGKASVNVSYSQFKNNTGIPLWPVQICAQANFSATGGFSTSTPDCVFVK